MKLLLLTILTLLFYSCEQPTDMPSSCPTVLKESPLHLELKIQQSTDNKIDLLFKIRNDSADTAILYKPLLPLDNKLTENIFSIFDTVNFEVLKPTIISKEQYCDGAIIPKLNKDNFVFLKPKDSIQSIINLNNYYDFQNAKKKHKKYFLLAPNLQFPLVNKDMKQLTEQDSISGRPASVYIWVHLPKRQDIDSMRVPFSIE